MLTKFCGLTWTEENIWEILQQNMKLYRERISCGDVEWINVVRDRSHKQAATNLYTEHFVDEVDNCQLSKKPPASRRYFARIFVFWCNNFTFTHACVRAWVSVHQAHLWLLCSSRNLNVINSGSVTVFLYAGCIDVITSAFRLFS
jgi:hypothetical protein